LLKRSNPLKWPRLVPGDRLAACMIAKDFFPWSVTDDRLRSMQRAYYPDTYTTLWYSLTVVASLISPFGKDNDKDVQTTLRVTNAKLLMGCSCLWSTKSKRRSLA